MKFLKKFATRAEYEAYMANNETYPFIGYIADEGMVEYVKEAPPERRPLRFEAIEDMTVSFSTNAIEYSFDNKTWQTLPAATATPTISAGNNVYFRASGLTPTSSGGIGTFSATGRFQASGNVKSMILGGNFIEDSKMPKEAFVKLFAGSTITYACDLIIPYATMAESGCKLMFQNCANLHTAPKKLPATTLAETCYYSMFTGCTSLINAPELPAKSLMRFCYGFMFNSCTSLVNAPELPATTLAESCCYSMFSGCTSLINAPELPATMLQSDCYRFMFQNCANLRYIKAMFITTPSTNYMDGWVSGVNSSGTFVKNAAATWSNTFGTSAIPTGWNVDTATK